MAQKQREFLPFFEERSKNTCVFWQSDFYFWKTTFKPWVDSRNEFVGHGFGSGTVERQVANAEEVVDSDRVEKAQGENFLDMVRRLGQRLVVRQSAGRGEIELIGESVRNRATE